MYTFDILLFLCADYAILAQLYYYGSFSMQSLYLTFWTHVVVFKLSYSENHVSITKETTSK